MSWLITTITEKVHVIYSVIAPFKTILNIRFLSAKYFRGHPREQTSQIPTHGHKGTHNQATHNYACTDTYACTHKHRNTKPEWALLWILDNSGIL